MYTEILRGNIPDYVPCKKGGGEDVAQVPPRLCDRFKAAELLEKHFTGSTGTGTADMAQKMEDAFRRVTELMQRDS